MQGYTANFMVIMQQLCGFDIRYHFCIYNFLAGNYIACLSGGKPLHKRLTLAVYINGILDNIIKSYIL
jgi:hypothetical protein